jgi:hypothetical protein
MPCCGDAGLAFQKDVRFEKRGAAVKQKKKEIGPAPEPTRLRKNKLAAVLKITRFNLDGHLKSADAPRPDFLKTFDVEEVRKYLSVNSLHHATSGATTGTKLNDVRVRKMEADARLAELELVEKSGEMISMKEASSTLIPLMAELAASLKQEFELTLPSQYVGKDEIECAELNRNAIDRIIIRFRSGAKKMMEEKP